MSIMRRGISFRTYVETSCRTKKRPEGHPRSPGKCGWGGGGGGGGGKEPAGRNVIDPRGHSSVGTGAHSPHTPSPPPFVLLWCLSLRQVCYWNHAADF